MPRGTPDYGYRRRRRRQALRRTFAEHWVRVFRGCAYCLRWLTVESLTIDHVVPRAKGGPDKLYNWVGCCYDCNQEKGPKVWVPAVDSLMLGLVKLSQTKSTAASQSKKRRRLTKLQAKLLARAAAKSARKKKAASKRKRRKR